jgi:hypothetical protein
MIGKEIATAPIKSGRHFGPCLLLADTFDHPEQPERWYIGAWSGDGWYEEESCSIIHPRRWCELPVLPPAPLKLQSIEIAPIKAGEEFGPVLLEVAEPYRAWAVGAWDGECWHDRDFTRVKPVQWCLLPPLSPFS